MRVDLVEIPSAQGPKFYSVGYNPRSQLKAAWEAFQGEESEALLATA